MCEKLGITVPENPVDMNKIFSDLEKSGVSEITLNGKKYERKDGKLVPAENSSFIGTVFDGHNSAGNIATWGIENKTSLEKTTWLCLEFHFDKGFGTEKMLVEQLRRIYKAKKQGCNDGSWERNLFNYDDLEKSTTRLR